MGGKWKQLILWHLGPQARRFAELRRLVGGIDGKTISEKMLSSSLKELESDGIITRRDFGEIPPRVEYSLTGLGVELTEAIRPLCEWGTKRIIDGVPLEPSMAAVAVQKALSKSIG